MIRPNISPEKRSPSIKEVREALDSFKEWIEGLRALVEAEENRKALELCGRIVKDYNAIAKDEREQLIRKIMASSFAEDGEDAKEAKEEYFALLAELPHVNTPQGIVEWGESLIESLNREFQVLQQRNILPRKMMENLRADMRSIYKRLGALIELLREIFDPLVPEAIEMLIPGLSLTDEEKEELRVFAEKLERKNGELEAKIPQITGGPIV